MALPVDHHVADAELPSELLARLDHLLAMTKLGQRLASECGFESEKLALAREIEGLKWLRDLTAPRVMSARWRWTARRKAELITQAHHLTDPEFDALLERFGVGREEFERWRELYGAHGTRALKSTKIQQFRSRRLRRR